MSGKYVEGIDAAIRAKQIDPLISNLSWYSETPPDTGARLEQLTEEIAKVPSAELYDARGAVYFHAKQYEQAIADFNKAIAMNPVLASPRNNLGGALIKTGDFAGAVKTCNIAISITRQTSPINLQAARQGI